jgi:hypothetical protein
MTELEQQYEHMQNELIDAKKEIYNLNNQHENLRKQFFEAGERYKANLRAINFMLTELQDVGTHHEKEVVIRYIKGVISKHIINPISYYPEREDLPF